MHVLDLVQNAFSAGARNVDVQFVCDKDADLITLEVSDDGRGMDEELLAAVHRGFHSTKGPRSIGLGIPLLREVAEHCDGSFDIESRRGQGTRVTATFRRTHIDLPPFGDLAKTFLTVLVTSAVRRVRITYRCDDRVLSIDTDEVHSILGEISLQSPEVIRFLQRYIAEQMEEKQEAT